MGILKFFAGISVTFVVGGIMLFGILVGAGLLAILGGR